MQSQLFLPSPNLQISARRSLIISPLVLPTRNLQFPARRLHIVRCGEWKADLSTKFSVGAVARAILKKHSGIEILAYVSRVNTVQLPKDLIDDNAVTWDQIENNILRCPNLNYGEKMTAAVVSRAVDSVGGVITCIVRNIPPIIHETEAFFFDNLKEQLREVYFSVPAANSYEFVSDECDEEFLQSGAVQGGMTSGRVIKIRIGFRPTATIYMGMGITAHGPRGYYPCFLPLAVPLVEAAMASEIALLLMGKLFPPN